MLTLKQKLTNYISAGYPLIYIVSKDQNRVFNILEDIAVTQKQRTLYKWSPIQPGWVIYSPKNPGKPTVSTSPPIDNMEVAIKEIRTTPEKSIITFVNVHNILEQDWISCQQLLKAIYENEGPGREGAKEKCQSIIIISPKLVVNEYLEKELAVIDHGVPTKIEITAVLKSILQTNETGLKEKPSDNQKDAAVNAALGLSCQEAENGFALAMIQTAKINDDFVRIVAKEKTEVLKRTGLLEVVETDLSMDQIGGMDNLKAWIKKRKRAFTPEAEKFGLPTPKGLLLLGIPGCGKSLTAKIIANVFEYPLLRFDVGRLFGSLVGQSEENARRALQVAETIAPCVLWLDEIEKGFAGMSGVSTDSGTTQRVFGQILTWMSEKTSPVFIVATANDIAQLPPELMRKGRFDEIFFVDLPTVPERKDIFKIHLLRRNRKAEDFDLDAMSLKAVDFTGSEIEESINEAMTTAFDAGRELAGDDILTAIGETTALAVTMQERITALREWAKNRARLAHVVRPVEIAPTETGGRKISGDFGGQYI